MGKAVAAIVCASATSTVGRLKLFFAFLTTTRFPFTTCSQSKLTWYPYTNSIIHSYFWGYFRVFEFTNLKNNHTSKHLETIRDYLLLVLFNSAVNEYVFPGTGGTGHIIEQRKQIAKGCSRIRGLIYHSRFTPHLYHRRREFRYSRICTQTSGQSQNEQRHNRRLHH